MEETGHKGAQSDEMKSHEKGQAQKGTKIDLLELKSNGTDGVTGMARSC